MESILIGSLDVTVSPERYWRGIYIRREWAGKGAATKTRRFRVTRWILRDLFTEMIRCRMGKFSHKPQWYETWDFKENLAEPEDSKLRLSVYQPHTPVSK